MNVKYSWVEVTQENEKTFVTGPLLVADIANMNNHVYTLASLVAVVEAFELAVPDTYFGGIGMQEKNLLSKASHILTKLWLDKGKIDTVLMVQVRLLDTPDGKIMKYEVTRNKEDWSLRTAGDGVVMEGNRIDSFNLSAVNFIRRSEAA